MRYIFFILSFFAISFTYGQGGVKDFQLRVDSTTRNPRPLSVPNIYIMGSDSSAGPYYNLGKWYHKDSLIGAALVDHDFYGLGTGTAPMAGEDSLETAMDSMYVLFKGLSGGLNHKIEFLKNGTMQFDQDEGIASKTQIIMRTLQQTEGNDPVYLSTSSNPNSTAARQNDQTVWGFNLGGVQQTIDAGDVGFGIAIENNYELLGKFYNELHFVHNDSSGTVRRPFTMFINRKFDWDWEAAFEVPNFYLRPGNTINEDPYFRFEIDTTNHIVYQYFRDPFYLNYGVRHIMDADNAHYTIENNGSASAFFNSSGFTGSSFSGFLKHTSFANNPTALTTYGDADYLGKTTLGWGLDFSGNTMIVDSSQVATQYDISSISGTDLTIGGAGPTYTIESSTGTDVTIAGGGIVTLSETPANTLVITATEVGTGTMDDFLIAAAGTGGTETISDGETVTFQETAGLDATRSTNTITYSLDLDELATDATPEWDEFIALSDGAATNEKTAILNVVPSIEVDGVAVSTGDVVLDFDGTDWSLIESPTDNFDITIQPERIQDIVGAMTTGNTETGITVTYQDADGTIDFVADDTSPTNEAWTIDGDDADTELITNQTVKFEGLGGILTNYIPSTNTMEIEYTGGAGDGNGIYDGSGTVPASTTVTLSDGNFKFTGGTAAVKIEDTGTSPSLVIEGNIGDADANFGSIVFQYSDADFATDQAAWTFNANRETDDIEHSTLQLISNEATSTPPAIVFENYDQLSDNTSETFTQINTGIAKTQYWESSSANAITLDRGYYNIALLSGHTGTITLPQIYGVAESYIEIANTQVPIGQEYVITNLSGSSVTIAAFNDTGSTNDDWLNNTEAGTFPLPDGSSIIVKATTIVSNEGRWYIYD